MLYPIELQAQTPECRSLKRGSYTHVTSGGEGGI